MDNRTEICTMSVSGSDVAIDATHQSVEQVISELSNMMGFELSQAEIMLMRPDLFSPAGKNRPAYKSPVTHVEPKEAGQAQMSQQVVIQPEQVNLAFPANPAYPVK